MSASTSRSPSSRRRASTSMPRKPVAPVRKTVGFMRRPSSGSRTSSRAVPIAWKPPSTCRISPVMARARSDSRNSTAPATGPVSSVSQPERRLALPRAGELLEARDPARGERAERARGDEVDAHALRARGHARGSARRPRARPWRRPSSRRPARRRSRRSPSRRSPRRPPSAAASRRSAPSASTRWSGTRSPRSRAACRGTCPPRASSGAKAIACRMPSTRPQRSRRSSATACELLGIVDVEVEHVDRLSAASSPRARSSAWRGRSRSARPPRRPPGPGGRPPTRSSRA